jgi:hypothetical protein
LIIAGNLGKVIVNGNPDNQATNHQSARLVIFRTFAVENPKDIFIRPSPANILFSFSFYFLIFNSFTC